MAKKKMFIIVFDNNEGLCIPYGCDAVCEGAIELNDGPVALFNTWKDANTAITISRKFADLQNAQGKPCNTDFSEYRKNIKILPATTTGGAT